MSDSECTYIVSKHERALRVSARKERLKIGIGINRSGCKGLTTLKAAWQVLGSNGEGRLNLFLFQVNFQYCVEVNREVRHCVGIFWGKK